LCRALHSVFLGTFLDCAPVVFAPAGIAPESETQLLLSIVCTIRDLYSTLLVDEAESLTEATQRSLCNRLGEILTHMAPYFPFGEGKLVGQDAKTEELLRDLCLVYCELTSLLSLVLARFKPTASTSSSRSTAKDARKDHAAAMRNEISNVAEYVIRSLQGSSKTVSNPMGQALSSKAYVGLLPTLWQSLNDTSTSQAILGAVLEHGTKISTSSAVKQKSVEFIGRLALLRTDPHVPKSFKNIWGAAESEKLRDWVLHLPKILWELGGTNPRFTEIILLFLLRFLQRKHSMINAQLTLGLAERLQPFFIVQHRSKGEISGPYNKIENELLRRLVLDVVTTLYFTGQPGSGLKASVEKAVKDSKEALYWQGIPRT